MLHFLLIDDSYPINNRNRKIIESLAVHYGQQTRISVVTWDRNNDYTDSLNDYYVYKKNSAYGSKTRKLFNIWGYRRFCHAVIKAQIPDVIIASHWNNLLMVPRLNNNQLFIYDNLDIPTESFVVRKMSTMLERWEMRRVNLTIHASRFFMKLYPSRYRQLVLENKPTFRAPPPKEYVIHTPIRIAFIGTIRYREILKLLIDAVRGDTRFELYFHGDGHARTYLEKYSCQEPNVFFTGKYAYEHVVKLYNQTDVLWAAYPNKDYNVKYAISNKFHESLLLGIPTVYSNNTFLGDFVEENHIGMTVDPYSKVSIKALLNQIIDHQEVLWQMGKNLRRVGKKQTSWDENFRIVIDTIDRYFDKKK